MDENITDWIDQELEKLRRKGGNVTGIRNGRDLWESYKEEIRGTPLMPSEGEPTEYQGIPLAEGVPTRWASMWIGSPAFERAC